MARNSSIINQYCKISSDEDELLNSAVAPIVLLDKTQSNLPDEIAPNQKTLGFMLPYTPLHHLILAGRVDLANVLLRHHTARNRIGELEPTATGQWLDVDHHVAELAVSATFASGSACSVDTVGAPPFPTALFTIPSKDRAESTKSNWPAKTFFQSSRENRRCR